MTNPIIVRPKNLFLQVPTDVIVSHIEPLLSPRDIGAIICLNQSFRSLGDTLWQQKSIELRRAFNEPHLEPPVNPRQWVKLAVRYQVFKNNTLATIDLGWIFEAVPERVFSDAFIASIKEIRELSLKIETLCQHLENARTPEGKRTITLIARHPRNAKVLENLLRIGVNPNCVPPETEEPMLFSAARMCNVAGIRSLIKYKADPSITDQHGKHPLHYYNTATHLRSQLAPSVDSEIQQLLSPTTPTSQCCIIA